MAAINSFGSTGFGTNILKPQAQPSMSACARAVGLTEAVEDEGQKTWIDTFARVAHTDLHLRA